MKKLLIGAAFCALFAGPVAAEPVKLSSTQMDSVTAAGVNINSNRTWQSATAVAVGGDSFRSRRSSNAVAVAVNVNNTRQRIDD
jgi:hypothetical protein